MIYFLDVDGVLANLNSAIYDRFKAQNKTNIWHLDIGKSNDEILESLDLDFWKNIPKLPWSDELIEMVDHTSNGKWSFLTKGPKQSFAWSGKMEWIKKHYPRHFDKLIICVEKSRLASHRHCLIDDYDINVNEFKKAGGEVIHFPSYLGPHFTREQLEDPVQYVVQKMLCIETQKFYRH